MEGLPNEKIRQEDLDLKENNQEKHPLVFVFAFFKSDGENGVHEDLCENVTAQEAINHGKELWSDADEYKISYTQLGDPYAELFKVESSTKREEVDPKKVDEVNKRLSKYLS